MAELPQLVPVRVHRDGHERRNVRLLIPACFALSTILPSFVRSTTIGARLRDLIK
jgi:hypothetical protein